MNRSALTGIVLAGGLSTRLGQDKKHLKTYGENEPDLLTRTINLLQIFCDKVLISCRNGHPVAGYDCILDEENNLGPLGGIYSALRIINGPIMVLSCDLPFINEFVLQRLQNAHSIKPADAIMTTYKQKDTGYIEPLVSIYESACLPYFSEALKNNIRQINKTIPDNLRYYMFYESYEAMPFFNINYPADLETARRLISALGNKQ